MKKLISAAFFLLTLAGCSEVFEDYDDVNIRLFNASEVGYTDIEFDPSTRLVSYDTLAPKKYTPYEKFERAYRYAFFRITVNDSVYVLQPVDYVGESPLTSGNYTYRVNLNSDNSMSFILVED